MVMVMRYQCRMPAYDGDDDWTWIDGWGHEDAAIDYAEQCDDGSGGEIFQDPTRHKEIVQVRLNEQDPIVTFEITFDYSKAYYATHIVEGDNDSHR